MCRVILSCLAIMLVFQPANGQMSSARSKTISLTPQTPESAPTATSAPKLPTLTIQMAFADAGDNGYLDAEESATLMLTISNIGKEPAKRLEVRVTPLTDIAGVTVGVCPVIDLLPGGGLKTVEIPISADGSVVNKQVKLKVEILEASGFDLDPPVVFGFNTKAFSPPLLVLADYAIEDQSGNGQIEPREIVEVTARIQNKGLSTGRAVTARVTLGENVNFESDSKRVFSFGNLKPGEYKDVKFSIYTNSRATGVPISISLKEARGLSDTTIALDLAFNKPQKKAIEFIAEGKTAGPVEIASAPSLAVDVDVNLPKTGMSNPDAVAIVIGNSNYQKTKPVVYASRDAMTVKRYLVETLGFKEGNIFFLTNATKSDLELHFGTKDNYQGRLFNTVKPNISDVFVYYSGHGAPGLKDRHGYFVPVECDPNYVEIQGYPLDVFYANLGKVRANSVTVVLDACFSGAGLFDNISPISLSIESPSFTLKNGVSFCSSTSDQASSWYAEKQHGMFTYFFLKAIHDRVADYNNDGKLTFEEIFRYLSDKSNGVPYYARRINGVDQVPTLQGDAKGRVFVKY